MSLIVRTQQIVDALQTRMDGLTFRWKGSDSTTEYIERTPTVYPFTYDNVSNGFPLDTPAICVQLLSVDNAGMASYLVHVCVCNSALMDKEITSPVKDELGAYEYGKTDGFDSAGVRLELYKFCLILGEQVYLALKQMSNTAQDINNVELHTPSPYLADFPYSECTVSFESDTRVLIETTNKSELEYML